MRYKGEKTIHISNYCNRILFKAGKQLKYCNENESVSTLFKSFSLALTTAK